VSSEVPRIAYFGLPVGALMLLHAGYSPALIVLGRRTSPGTRRLRKLARDIPILTVPTFESARELAVIARAEPDVILSWFYPRRIGEQLLALAGRGAFGTHPSLLPRWRGPDPYFWAIYSGDHETGVTLHRLDAEYDTGAIVAQRRLAIDPRENAFQLAKRLDRPALALLLECVGRLTRGEALEGQPQPSEGVTLAPTPDEELLAIDWRRPTDELARLVRAAAPYPAASAELGAELVDVIEAEPHAASLPRALEPADAVLTPRGVVVCTGDGGLVVRAVRRESGETLRDGEVAALFGDGIARLGF
jgi:methionyl-tRNA formyltransferase